MTLVGEFIIVFGLISVFSTGSIGVDAVPSAGAEGVVPPAQLTTTVAPNNPAATIGTTIADADDVSVAIDSGTDPGLVPIPSPSTTPPETTTTSASVETSPDTTEASTPSAELIPAPSPPPTETTTTEAPPATTPTLPEPPPPLPPDTTPPAISKATASPGQVSELDGFGISCPAGTSRLSRIAASVTDTESGVATVKASWTIGGSTSTIAMALVAGKYTVDFGPFQAGTVEDNTSPSITITITALDSAGNESKISVSVVVNSIAKCFI